MANVFLLGNGFDLYHSLPTRYGNFVNTVDFLKENDKYIRFDESHTERVFADEEITKALTENGFEIIEKFDDFTYECVNDKSERIMYVCKNTLKIPKI